MEDKGVEIAKFLFDKQKQEFDVKRIYEWKVNFGLWLGMGALSGFLFNSTSQFDNLAFPITLTVILAVIFYTYTWKWTAGQFRRNNDGRKKATAYLNLLRAELDMEPVVYRTETMWSNWSRSAQILTTACFVALAIIAIWHKATGP